VVGYVLIQVIHRKRNHLNQQRKEMESIDALDILNTLIAAFAILGGMAYAIIKTKIDVEHLTKKVETLFQLWNDRNK